MIRRQLAPAVLAFIAFTVLTGVLYPLAVTAVAQVSFPERADGSLIRHRGTVVGSRLIGQSFAGSRYFHPRPSAAGDGYDAMASSASNLGPASDELAKMVRERIAVYRLVNGLPSSARVPIDAVTSSGSGLDAEISPENASLQAARVAETRGLTVEEVIALVDGQTRDRSLGFLGERGVNVLELNVALDALGR